MSDRYALDRFVEAVVSRLGFRVHEHNEEQVEQVLQHCLKRTGARSVDDYIARFEELRFAHSELRVVAQELTVPETYFFRHPEQFRALSDFALPERMKARQAVRRLNLLSAGCATGEEAYSLAAVLDAVPGLQNWDIAIRAIDINPPLLEKARLAKFPAWSLRGVSDEQRARYFRAEGKGYVLDAQLRSAVHFETRNLVDEDAQFWRPDFFDVVFCRNVMIYFSAQAVRSLVMRLTRSLAPGGFLFLGPSETLRGISQEFHLRHAQGTFFYQRRLPHERGEPARVQPHAQPAAAAPAARTPAARAPTSQEAGWADSIARANARIAVLADQTRPRPGDPATAVPAPAAIEAFMGDLQGVRDLLREERFADALQMIGSLPQDAGADPDALLMRAIVLANTGELSEAERVCQGLLARDELRPGAHYLLAFCQERRGDYLSAAEHDRTAIYLEPDFAMAHLHLGLLAKRLGDVATARRELGEALTLLAREDPSRILLFGGGFDRGALMRLCESQLNLTRP